MENLLELRPGDWIQANYRRGPGIIKSVSSELHEGETRYWIVYVSLHDYLQSGKRLLPAANSPQNSCLGNYKKGAYRWTHAHLDAWIWKVDPPAELTELANRKGQMSLF